MKGLMIFLISLIFCLAGNAQKPENLFYQAVMRDLKGEILDNREVSLRISILAGSTSGIVIFSENQKAVTGKDGLISVSIGSGTDKTSSLASIDWNATSYFLKVEADPSGGDTYSQISITPILNIPFETQKKSARRSGEIVIEDEFLVTRKFIGEYIDYRHTGPEASDGPNIIWIKTSLDKTLGKLSAYGKVCEFKKGENLYLRRIFYSPGDVSGYWIYQVENDSSVYYRLTEFQYDKKVYVETLFLH